MKLKYVNNRNWRKGFIGLQRDMLWALNIWWAQHISKVTPLSATCRPLPTCVSGYCLSRPTVSWDTMAI